MASASVVVLDDDRVVRERIAQELRELGFSVADERSSEASSRLLKAGEICVDVLSRRVSVNNVCVSIASREYQLLLFLLHNQDRVFSRKQLLDNVWARDVSVGGRTVDVYIRRLRAVLERFECDRYVQTVRGVGYRFSLRT